MREAMLWNECHSLESNSFHGFVPDNSLLLQILVVNVWHRSRRMISPYTVHIANKRKMLQMLHPNKIVLSRLHYRTLTISNEDHTELRRGIEMLFICIYSCSSQERRLPLLTFLLSLIQMHCHYAHVTLVDNYLRILYTTL